MESILGEFYIIKLIALIGVAYLIMVFVKDRWGKKD